MKEKISTSSLFDMIKEKETEILQQVISDKRILSSFSKTNLVDENEINFLLINNERDNLYYQIHANVIRSLIKLIFSRMGNGGKIFNFQFFDDIHEILPTIELDFQIRYLSPTEIIEIMESLHYDFLNSEYIYQHGILNRRRSKIFLMEKGSAYTPSELATKIVEMTISQWMKRNNSLDDISVLDFGCGTGRFYFAALEFLKEKLDKNYERIIKENLYAIDIDPIALAILMIRDCNITNNYSSKFLHELEKNIVCKNMLHVKKDIASEDHGINYRKEFPRVFRADGFDVIVSNPPYFVLKGTGNKINTTKFYSYLKDKIERDVKYFRENKFYTLAIEGMLNYYRFSIECILKITSKRASIGIICPATLFGDTSASKIRRELFEKNSISTVEYFPEKSKFFENITQATTVFIMDKNSSTKSFKLVNYRDGNSVQLSIDSICKVFPDYEIPFIGKNEWKILEKINKFKKIRNISAIRNKRGELDLTLFKKYITNRDTAYPLIRGNDVRENRITPSGKEFVIIRPFLRKKSLAFIENDFEKIRIAGQQIVNIDAKKRLKFALTDKNHILGNSCNYISITGPLDINWILAQLNSFLLNWRFKIVSTNNHVNNYEIDELPIVKEAPKSFKRIKDDLERNVLVCKEFGLSINETKLILKEHFTEIEINRVFKEMVA